MIPWAKSKFPPASKSLLSSAMACFLKHQCCRSARLNESEIFNSNQSLHSHRQPKHSTKTLSYMQMILSFSLCSCCSLLDLVYFLVSAAFYPTLSGWILWNLMLLGKCYDLYDLLHCDNIFMTVSVPNFHYQLRLIRSTWNMWLRWHVHKRCYEQCSLQFSVY